MQILVFENGAERGWPVSGAVCCIASPDRDVFVRQNAEVAHVLKQCKCLIGCGWKGASEVPIASKRSSPADMIVTPS